MLTTPNGEVQLSKEREELCRLVAILGASNDRTTSSQLVEDLSRRYINERSLSSHPLCLEFSQVFEELVRSRFDSDSSDYYQSEYFLRILIWVKIFIRDPSYQRELFHLGGVKILSKVLRAVTRDYLNFEDEVMGIEVLKVMTNIFQKLSVEPSQRLWLIACDVPQSLVLLLCARDLSVLNCTLYALIDLARSDQARVMIGEMNCVETLLHILQDYTNPTTRQLSSELLRQLCSLDNVKEQVKVFDGIPLCLSVLHEEDLTLLFNIVSIVERLSSDNDSSSDIRELGGMPLLINIIQDQVNKTTSSVGEGSSLLTEEETRQEEEEGGSITARGGRDTVTHVRHESIKLQTGARLATPLSVEAVWPVLQDLVAVC